DALPICGHVVTTLARLVLLQAHGGDLRVGEHCRGDVPFVHGAQVLGVGEVVRDDPGLGIGHVLELVRRGDVAQSPYAVHGGAAVGVCPHPVVLVGLDARSVQVEAVGVRGPSGGHEQQLGAGTGAVGEVEVHTIGMFDGGAHLGIGVQPPAGGGLAGEGGGDVAVLGA